MQRTACRAIDRKTVDMVVAHGRTVYARGATIHVIGRKEVQQAKLLGIDIAHCQAVHVVCSSVGGPVTTVYRNPNLRGLRPLRHRCTSQSH
ncbi:MAG: DUF4258 domain-containing protein, partial [bacterium]|nr:DUF4258 domain-containing protein [bacterium]